MYSVVPGYDNPLSTDRFRLPWYHEFSLPQLIAVDVGNETYGHHLEARTVYGY